MRRVTKSILLFFLGIFFTGFYCEFLIYYVVIAQCSWPVLQNAQNSGEVLKVFMMSDPHLLGPRRGHWLDKLRREWQMHQAYKAIMTLHTPEVIFVLGDLFDEGEWTNTIKFQDYIERFYTLFAVPDNVKMHVVAGNHDIGFHNYIRRGAVERFYKSLNSSSVQLLTLKNIHFVLLNSMAMEGDSCQLCTRARKRIENISVILKCSENPSVQCKDIKQVNYSRPILLQILHPDISNSLQHSWSWGRLSWEHFPLHRLSDSVCTEPDAPPYPERNKPFRLKIDALSKEATDLLVTKIKPRAVFGGHTHHGCLLNHSYNIPEILEFSEYSIPSFSWRNRPDPKYMLVSISSNDFAVNKCGLPKETTISMTAVILIIISVWFSIKRRRVGR